MTKKKPAKKKPRAKKALLPTYDTRLLRVESLIDRITTYAGWTLIADLKSTNDASQWAFGSSVAKYGYHEQAAFYLEGLNVLAPVERRFLFIAVEKERPFCCAIHELDDEAISEGTRLFRKHLRQLRECKEDNLWPGYPAEISTIQLPKWAISAEV